MFSCNHYLFIYLLNMLLLHELKWTYNLKFGYTLKHGISASKITCLLSLQFVGSVQCIWAGLTTDSVIVSPRWLYGKPYSCLLFVDILSAVSLHLLQYNHSHKVILNIVWNKCRHGRTSSEGCSCNSMICLVSFDLCRCCFEKKRYRFCSSIDHISFHITVCRWRRLQCDLHHRFHLQAELL